MAICHLNLSENRLLVFENHHFKVDGPPGATMQCSVVYMVCVIYYRESHSASQVRKNMKFSWFLNGNIITVITGNTFSDQGMLFGTFLMKNIFIKFPTPILTHNFCMISSKNPMIFIGFICTIMMYSHKPSKFASKKHEIFKGI